MTVTRHTGFQDQRTRPLCEPSRRTVRGPSGLPIVEDSAPGRRRSTGPCCRGQKMSAGGVAAGGSVRPRRRGSTARPASGAPMRNSVLPPELGRDFRKIWPAAAISNLGDGAMLAAGPLLVASITDEPAAVGAAAFIQQLPWLLFALFSGALADRLDRRLMVVAADTFRAVVLGALGFAVLLDASPLWAVYVVLFLMGTAETLADNASGALLVTAVPKEHLGMANARLYLTGTIGNQLVGPSIGALLFAVAAGVPLLLNAVTFAAAAALMSRVSIRPPLSDGTPRTALWLDVREGVRWLWNHAGVRTVALAILVMNITLVAAFATWVLYAKQRLGLSDTQYGLLVSGPAVGALAGMPVYHFLEPRVGSLTLLRTGLV